ncbi:MAG: lytic transglycosylase domain-containing protein [Treponema sp.]|nr:lytic transglycosylase domain-containing protein [Treponema sp.]
MFLVYFSSCGLALGVMGLPRKEAAGRLKEGDIGFILEADVPAKFSSARAAAKELGRIHPSAPFYAGLLVKSAESSKAKALFAAALESPSPDVRKEAASELVLPVLEDDKPEAAGEIFPLTAGKKDLLTLRAACLYRLGNFAGLEKLYPAWEERSSWDEALFLLSRLNREKQNEDFRRDFTAFLFSVPPIDSRDSGDPREWARKEFLRLEAGGFSPAETAALAGRAAANRSDFARGINHFRLVLEQEPGLFFQNPGLINDLGRCFQFTPAAREEGAALFASWSLMPENGQNPDLLYRLLYFAGRIERQREDYGRSNEFFRKALDRAPDPLQSDACLWYMLTNTLAEKSEAAVSFVKAYMPRMNSSEYFSDIFDRLSCHLVSQGQWEAMLEVFTLLRLQGTNGAMIAQYAWILGRAVEEGFLEPPEALGAGKDEAARAFFRIGFEKKDASFYYRIMSASKLGSVPVPSLSAPPAGQNSKARPEMEFLLAFFEFGASDFAYSYILKREKNLTLRELRILAETLTASERRDQALNLIGRYMARKDYEINSEDMTLYYPRHFGELIENSAREAGLGAEILFGLVRTESYFMPAAVSRSGAVGLAQLMEPTALDMAGRIARQGGPDYRTAGGIDLRDPETNVRIGAYYLGYLIKQTGSPMTALLAYNGGMGRVRRWRAASKLPEDLFLETIVFDETREYGRRVLAAAAVYGYLYYGMSMEEVVADVYSNDVYNADAYSADVYSR